MKEEALLCAMSRVLINHPASGRKLLEEAGSVKALLEGGSKLATDENGYIKPVKANTEIIALHPDFSLCESLDRLAEEAPIFGKNFDKVLLDNASNGYCRSHQYEMAAGCYIPFAETFVREVLRRIEAGERERIPDEWVARTRETCLNDLKGRGIEAYRPSSPRTADEYRRVLTTASQVSAKVFVVNL